MLATFQAMQRVCFLKRWDENVFWWSLCFRSCCSVNVECPWFEDDVDVVSWTYRRIQAVGFWDSLVFGSLDHSIVNGLCCSLLCRTSSNKQVRAGKKKVCWDNTRLQTQNNRYTAGMSALLHAVWLSHSLLSRSDFIPAGSASSQVSTRLICGFN